MKVSDWPQCFRVGEHSTAVKTGTQAINKVKCYVWHFSFGVFQTIFAELFVTKATSAVA